MRAATLLVLLLVGCSQPDVISPEGSTAGDCSDDADNDRDGLFDCQDDGCAELEACAPPVVDDGEPRALLTGATVLPEADPCLAGVVASPDRTTVELLLDCPLSVVIEPGSVLVGAQSRGYLVFVDSVSNEGDRLVLQTRPAALAEGFEALRASARFTDPGRWSEGFEETLPIFGPIEVTARGELTFAPEYTFELDYDWDGLYALLAEVEGALAASLELEIAAAVAWEEEGEVRLPIEIEVDFPILLGPIPLIVGIEIGATLAYSIDVDAQASVTMGVSAAGDVRLGVEYDPDSDTFVPRREVDVAMEVAEPEVDELEAKVQADVRLLLDVTFGLYGVDGPWVGAGPYADGCVHLIVDDEGPLVGWEYSYGLTAAGGVQLDLLWGLVDIDEEVEFPGMPLELGEDAGSWRPVGGE